MILRFSLCFLFLHVISVLGADQSQPDDCCICLEPLNVSTVYPFTCGKHGIHSNCYNNLVTFTEKGFPNCPLCNSPSISAHVIQSLISNTATSQSNASQILSFFLSDSVIHGSYNRFILNAVVSNDWEEFIVLMHFYPEFAAILNDTLLSTGEKYHLEFALLNIAHHNSGHQYLKMILEAEKDLTPTALLDVYLECSRHGNIESLRDLLNYFSLYLKNNRNNDQKTAQMRSILKDIFYHIMQSERAYELYIFLRYNLISLSDIVSVWLNGSQPRQVGCLIVIQEYLFTHAYPQLSRDTEEALHRFTKKISWKYWQTLFISPLYTQDMMMHRAGTLFANPFNQRKRELGRKLIKVICYKFGGSSKDRIRSLRLQGYFAF